MKLVHPVTAYDLQRMKRISEPACLIKLIYKAGGLFRAAGIQQTALYCICVFQQRFPLPPILDTSIIAG